MSYIDSQIRELREIAEIYEGMDGGELLKECADTIESLCKKLTEKSNGGWIPCSERLPEKHADVLVSFGGCGNIVIAWYSEVNKQWKNSSTDNVIKAEVIA